VASPTGAGEPTMPTRYGGPSAGDRGAPPSPLSGRYSCGGSDAALRPALLAASTRDAGDGPRSARRSDARSAGPSPSRRGPTPHPLDRR